MLKKVIVNNKINHNTSVYLPKRRENKYQNTCMKYMILSRKTHLQQIDNIEQWFVPSNANNVYILRLY